MRRRTAALVTAAVAASVVAWAPIASASYTFVASWGGSGTGPGQFNQPRGLAVSSSGDVYVADSLNNRVQRFAADGTFLGQWGGAGAGDGQFQGPYGVTIGPTGDVFVVDRNNHRVQRFSPSGAFVSTFGSVGAGSGQLSHPSALAIDSSGNVFVADYDNRRIVKFDANGNFLTAWGSQGTGNGQFNLPDGIASDAIGDVYVIDGSNRVQNFSPAGAFVLAWGSAGTADGQFSGTGGIAEDSNGSIFVSDFNGRRIERFSPSGVFAESFGNGGTGPGQFNRPDGIATAPAGDVYVSDLFGQRILRFRKTAGGALPPPVVGQSVNVRSISGVVRIKSRGSRSFVVLTTGGSQIAVGSTVDTLHGRVELTSAASSAGATQTGQFYSGVFVVAQKRARKPVTDLRLSGGKFGGCPRAAAAGGPKRRLWGVATGRFRTLGRFAAAAVRGTTWLTEDRCKGTLVRATKGSLTVRDLVKKRSLVLKAPRSYFAKAKR